MTRAASAALAVALVGLVWILVNVAWYRHGQIIDYPVYQGYGDAVVKQHAVPYRDFSLEYPPAALPVFVLPSLVHGISYHLSFQALMALCDVALVLCVLAIAGRRAAVLAAIAPLLLGSVVHSRFDLWPAALVAAALALLVRGRTTWSAVAIGTAFAAKLWPAVLVPLLALHVWRTRGRRDALRWLGAAVAVAAAWFLPFVALSPGGVAHSFHEQLARPLQIESLGAALLIAAHHVLGTSLHVVGSFGSQNLSGPGTHAASLLTSAAEVVAVALVWALYARGEPTVERLLLACAAAVAALLAFGKVFSPQFLIWLVPLVPLVRSVAARGLFVAALVLTQLYFPKRYWRLVDTFSPFASWVVFLRDLAVVALFGLLVYGIQRSTAASSSRASPLVSARSGARTSG